MPISYETIEYRKNNNLCVRCGLPNETGKSLCRKHLDNYAKLAERRRDRCKQEGRCLSCGKNSEGQKFCGNCAEKVKKTQQKSQSKRYYSRKKDGLCVFCGKPSNNNLAECDSCRGKHNIEQQNCIIARKNSGLCVVCGKDMGDDLHKRCSSCRSKRKEWYATSETKDKMYARSRERKRLIVDYYGGKCTCCGESELAFLALDHIEGGGNIHRKELQRYGSSFYDWIINNNFPEGFQILCHNCNHGKYSNRGICPHKDPKTLDNSLDLYVG